MLPSIGFDIDDTIIVSETTVREYFYYLTRHGIANDPDVYFKTHNWKLAVPGGDPNELYAQYIASGEAPMPTPMPGAHEVLQEIQELYSIHLVTTRHPDALLYIQSHLEEIMFPHVRFTSIHPCGGTTKAPRLAEINAVFFVDDSIKELHSLKDEPNLTLVQFPYFSREGSPRINHPSVIRLQACDRIGKDDPDKVRYSAWQEIRDIMMEFAGQTIRQTVA